MLKLFVTMFRGRGHDAAEAVVDANAVPILRQQLRDCAQSVELGRKSVAMVMACCERERKSAEQIATQLADLEVRAKEALLKGREDLAIEAAGAIAHLEAERDTTASAIATYQAEITRLRTVLSESEGRLRARVYRPAMGEAARREARLREDIAGALERRDARLVTHHHRATQSDLRGHHRGQPLVAAHTTTVVTHTEMFEAGTDGTPPDWVRFCLLGIPNRTGAQFWYQLSCTAGLVSGAGAILLPSILSPAHFFAAGLWFFGCAAISAKAIRWMDAHSAWDRLTRE
jgi:phage shock protein A